MYYGEKRTRNVYSNTIVWNTVPYYTAGVDKKGINCSIISCKVLILKYIYTYSLTLISGMVMLLCVL